jgi:small-conductance mechanosensitive channel
MSHDRSGARWRRENTSTKLAQVVIFFIVATQFSSPVSMDVPRRRDIAKIPKQGGITRVFFAMSHFGTSLVLGPEEFPPPTQRFVLMRRNPDGHVRALTLHSRERSHRWFLIRNLHRSNPAVYDTSQVGRGNCFYAIFAVTFLVIVWIGKSICLFFNFLRRFIMQDLNLTEIEEVSGGIRVGMFFVGLLAGMVGGGLTVAGLGTPISFGGAALAAEGAGMIALAVL